ncbi:AMP-binding protein [Rothia terrae]
MKRNTDYLDSIFSEYFTVQDSSQSIYFEDLALTKKELKQHVERCLETIDKKCLDSDSFIVLRGKNSPNQLAWIFSAILKHIPFASESDGTHSLSSILVRYGPVLEVDTDSFDSNLLLSNENLEERPSKSKWAYIVSTSGSTGVPKIIPISRNNLSSYLRGLQKSIYIPHDSTWLWEHRLSFDASLWEVFGAILFKSNLNIVPKPVIDWGNKEIEFLTNNPSHVITLTPSELKSLSRFGKDIYNTFFKEVMTLFFLGERLGADALQYLPPYVTPNKVNIYNAYGPSETTIICSLHQLKQEDLSLPSVPLGSPFDGTTFRVDSESGELFISGPCVFSGYLGNTNKIEKEYPTGDIVDQSKDGQLIFKNRVSGYLNVNGKRIDPFPIVEAICKHPKVLDAHVWAKTVPPFDQILAAVKTDYPDSISSRDLRSIISKTGSKNIPTKYYYVKANDWPISKRGKLNPQALIKQLEKNG